jgi:hypothetical protein
VSSPTLQFVELGLIGGVGQALGAGCPQRQGDVVFLAISSKRSYFIRGFRRSGASRR